MIVTSINNTIQITLSVDFISETMQILNLIKGKYLTENQRNPDFFCYDLSDCFSQLQQLLTSDEPPPGCNGSPAPSTNTINPNPPKNQLPMVRMIEHLNTSLDELKEQNARLTQIITQQNEELRVLHEKHDEEYIFRSMPTQFRAILN
ncbi:MAG: hypothetical protein PHP33_07230 [Bacteroidales bacterium]|nr:hypothetical protein [Bacteroidales bacterium]